MIVDASAQCHTVTFNLGSSSTETRSWDIKVTQHTCNERDVVGPDGCLQWITGQSGTIASYNYPTTLTTLGTDVTHLSDQCYDICIRTENNFCAICYIPSITSTTAIVTNSFGLSVSPSATIVQGGTGTACQTDFLVIPGAVNAPITVGTSTALGDSKICGRFFSSITAATAGVSVCTQTRPFRITFKSDSFEATTATGANMANVNEQNGMPAGIVGFSLNYQQVAC